MMTRKPCTHPQTWTLFDTEGYLHAGCITCSADLKAGKDTTRAVSYPIQHTLDPEPVDWQYIPELDGMTTPDNAPHRGEYNGFVYNPRGHYAGLTYLQVVTPTGYTYDTTITPEEWSLPQ